MILITSAAYLDQEFSSEFGRIPPAFLPVGNKRLFNYQIESLPDERLVLTVPDTFAVPVYDRQRLVELGVEVLPIPEGLSLGESVVCAINLSGHTPDAPLKILHGDTLITDLPAEEHDIITISEVDGNYDWAVYGNWDDGPLRHLDESDLARPGVTRIANGYFSFSDTGLLVRSITKQRGNFIAGINLYAGEQPLAAIAVEQWFDFGHIHTFYRSKSHVTTQRAFNRMSISPKTVRKASADVRKMAGEAYWFKQLPEDLRIYTPHFIRDLELDEQSGYEIEYLYLTSLNELYVFGSLPAFVWRRIFMSCCEFLAGCRGHPAPLEARDSAADLFENKTRRRLEQYTRDTGVSLRAEWQINGSRTPGLERIANDTLSLIPGPRTEQLCVTHGDFCFSNILYDFRTQAIHLIDPRGLDAAGNLTVYGNQNYDLAKLAHSVIGLYDFIIAGHYALQASDRHLVLELPANRDLHAIQALFVQMMSAEANLCRTALDAMQVHLFLSMLPLHGDEPHRQQALLANALRLYAAIDGNRA